LKLDIKGPESPWIVYILLLKKLFKPIITTMNTFYTLCKQWEKQLNSLHYSKIISACVTFVQNCRPMIKNYLLACPWKALEFPVKKSLKVLEKISFDSVWTLY
jgi:hypothetical protein